MSTNLSKLIITLFFAITLSQSLYAQSLEQTDNKLNAAVNFSRDTNQTILSADSIVKSQQNISSSNMHTLSIGTLYTNELLQNADSRSMKKNTNLDYGLKEIMLLQPVTYNWKKNVDSITQIGLIAQDVRKVIPEVVAGNESVEMLGINYQEIIPVLINALKEQHNEIKEITDSINETKNTINLLKAKQRTKSSF